MASRKTFASLALIAALAAAPALAADEQHDQHHPGAAPGAGGAMPMMGQGGMMGRGMMGQHVEGRIAFLKAELKITDAQLPLWTAFAHAMRDNATTIQGMMAGGMMGMMNQAGTLPEKLAAQEKLLSARVEALHKLKTATDPLYAALSVEQKKTADELMIGPMGMMM